MVNAVELKRLEPLRRPAQNENHRYLEELRSNVEKLFPNQQSFAKSLISQFDTKGKLSDKQWPYVKKMRDQVLEVPAEPKKAEETVHVGSMTKLVELFDNAKDNGIQYPKLRYESDGVDMVLSMAGPTARLPGSINVVCDGTWMGRINREGDFEKSKYGATSIDLTETLKTFCENPLEEAEAYGKRTGRCCLCGRTLTNLESIERGIGPICVDNWGL